MIGESEAGIKKSCVNIQIISFNVDVLWYHMIFRWSIFTEPISRPFKLHGQIIISHHHVYQAVVFHGP